MDLKLQIYFSNRRRLVGKINHEPFPIISIFTHPPMYRTALPETANAVDRSIPEPDPASIAEEDRYFKTNRAPDYLPQVKLQIESFISDQVKRGRRIAVVTSGGTTVPLENNTVRFIDNFSAGTRGATSTEYFIRQGYAVIFIHRQFSVMPFSRHYTHTTNILDYVEEKNGTLQVKDQFKDEMIHVLREYERVKSDNLLCLVPFTTVNQYLFTLRLVSEELSSLVPRNVDVLFYLAAAVSDFFLPQSRVSEHKIQSNGGHGGKLIVDLDPVPKFLRRLVDEWTPGAMIVSFKLETDESILLKKAKTALDRYSHQLVIGNLLQHRKTHVIFVTPESDVDISLTPEQVEKDVEIESLIIPKVVQMHDEWIQEHESSN